MIKKKFCTYCSRGLLDKFIINGKVTKRCPKCKKALEWISGGRLAYFG